MITTPKHRPTIRKSVHSVPDNKEKEGDDADENNADYMFSHDDGVEDDDDSDDYYARSVDLLTQVLSQDILDYWTYWTS